MLICLDCETTGLNPEEDEILQLAIIDGEGNTLFNRYMKPMKAVQWLDAQRVNHISPDMVKDLPNIDAYKAEIEDILSKTSLIVGYNLIFDLSFIKQVVKVPDVQRYDVMLEFAEIYGEWSDYFSDYKWQKLTTCARYYDYLWTAGAHDALADAQATLFCYKRMTEKN